MSQVELGVLPSGHLHVFSTESDGHVGDQAGQAITNTAFTQGIVPDLIALAAQENTNSIPSTLGYWRTFAGRYLAERCQMTPLDVGHSGPVTALD